MTTVSLCFLTQNYKHAYDLIQKLYPLGFYWLGYLGGSEQQLGTLTSPGAVSPCQPRGSVVTAQGSLLGACHLPFPFVLLWSEKRKAVVAEC